MFRNWSVDKLIIVSTTLCVLSEVVINFITSYQHIYDLGLKFGEYGVDARLMPVGIDLMLLAFAEVNLFLSRRGRKSTWMRLGLAVGVLGTVLANAAYGASWGATGASLAFWSPLALFATVEAGMMLLRVAAEDAAKAKPIPAAPLPADYPMPASRGWDYPVVGPPGPSAKPVTLADAEEFPDAIPKTDQTIQQAAIAASEAAAAAEPEGKPQAPPQPRPDAWQGLSGIGLSNGARG